MVKKITTEWELEELLARHGTSLESLCSGYLANTEAIENIMKEEGIECDLDWVSQVCESKQREIDDEGDRYDYKYSF